MTEETTTTADEAVIRLHIRPIDITAKGSAAEVRQHTAIRLKMMRTHQDAVDDSTSEPKAIAYYEAIAERDAFVKARSYTEDGSDLEAAWADISQVQLNTYFYELLAGGSGVPKAKGEL